MSVGPQGRAVRHRRCAGPCGTPRRRVRAGVCGLLSPFRTGNLGDFERQLARGTVFRADLEEGGFHRVRRKVCILVRRLPRCRSGVSTHGDGLHRQGMMASSNATHRCMFGFHLIANVRGPGSTLFRFDQQIKAIPEPHVSNPVMSASRVFVAGTDRHAGNGNAPSPSTPLRCSSLDVGFAIGVLDPPIATDRVCSWTKIVRSSHMRKHAEAGTSAPSMMWCVNPAHRYRVFNP